MTGNITPFPKPKLRTDEAEKIIRDRANETKNVIFGNHAFDRVDERGISTVDALNILRSGYILEAPELTERGEWKVQVQKQMGARKAAVLTVILNDQKRLFVKTVMWLDR